MAKKFYAVHTLSGQEGKVKEHLEHQIVANDLQHLFGKVLLPTQEVLSIRKGKKISQTKKFFPSYLIVEVELTRESTHLVVDSPGVTNFVGNSMPQALRPDEVEKILGKVNPDLKKKGSDIPYTVGEFVKINDGPFRDFDGTIEEVSIEKGKLKVMVSVFGRLTPVELDFLQVSSL